ncbi:MAG TPA: 2Fe-2S iron-sulfur cluster-binding protein [Vulgatibacter sp.]|nr:2Fe-2S iron-sulfur cluster-binding protein [Vulgatibacter sp.]
MAKAERLPGGAAGREIRLEFEGERIPAREGEPIAAALLAAGVDVFSRAVKYHRARGPFCLSGRCSHCVMRVDGEPNAFACTTPARDGCKIERQNAFPGVEHDVFRTIDWMYPRGLDHHTLFAGVPIVEKVVAKVARQMAGLGLLPDAARADGARFLEHEVDVTVIGGGTSGFHAALAASALGARVTVVDEQGGLGGRLRTGLHPEERTPATELDAARRAALERAGVHVLSRTFAFGLYREEGLLVAARAPERRLLVIRPRAVVLATGATELLPPFANNDLPGVYAGRALARLVHADRVLPAKEFVVAGDDRAERDAVAALLRDAGATVVAAPSLRGPDRILRARGRARVAGVLLAGPDGGRKLRCEAIAVTGETSAFLDLARHAGARVEWRGSGFAVVTDERQGTGVPRIFACGEVTGRCTPKESADQGAIAGRSAAEEALALAGRAVEAGGGGASREEKDPGEATPRLQGGER